jgi:type II secretory pathway component HofQ
LNLRPLQILEDEKQKLTVTEAIDNKLTPGDITQPKFGSQDEYGNDLSLLRANLRLTPAERMIKHERALNLMLEVRRAGRQARLFGDSSRTR